MKNSTFKSETPPAHPLLSLPLSRVRVVAQVFFFLLFCGLILVNSFGSEWYQKSGWPVNFFFNLDPLIALTTTLSTHHLYAPLAWSLVILIPTFFLGRFFCSWVCPFGSLHHVVSWLFRPRDPLEQVKANRYRPVFQLKYILFFFLLVLCIGNFSDISSLQIGLLDPFCLFYRSVSTVLLPAADWPLAKIYPSQPLYQGAWLIGLIFLTLVGLNLVIPRFFCRVLCPLGAMLGLCSRWAVLRVEHKSKCSSAALCQSRCPGACQPHGRLRLSECMACFNCLDDCPENALTFGPPKPESPPVLAGPGVPARRVFLGAIGGLLALPLARLSGTSLRNWNPNVIRPPGSLPENQFLQACLKCGQCMRICPTHVLQPAEMEAGVEGIWTPVLNNRLGRGCMPNCTACTQICPSAAIRPLTIERKRGLGLHAPDGPIRLGTAFVDQGRCLPWAMDRPCGVCEEVCPVSPKAIFMRTVELPLRLGSLSVVQADAQSIVVAGSFLPSGRLATGDYRCEVVSGTGQGQKRTIRANTTNTLVVDMAFIPPPDSTSNIVMSIVLARPYVDPERCIGCGICEHECPVSGLRAIRVTAENETRSRERSLLLRS